MLHLTPILDDVPEAILAPPAILDGEAWDTSCLDWEARLLDGRSLVPELPLFEAEAARALRVFKRLRLPDVIGTPTLGEACGPWFFPIVAALFGSYGPGDQRPAHQRGVPAHPEGQQQSRPTAAR